MSDYKIVDAEKLDADLSSVADAIRTKGGTSESLTFPQGFVDAVGAIESGGGDTEEIENLIDQSGVLDSTDGTVEEKAEQLIDKAERDNALYEATKEWTTQFQRLFFRNKSIKKLPYFNYENATTLLNFNYESTVEEVDYYINSSKATSHIGCFEYSSLKRMVGVDTSKSENINGMFNGCPVEIIERAFDLSCVLDTTHSMNGFSTALSLVEVRFIDKCIKWSLRIGSPVLSNESIQSIIDGLAYVTTTQTLTLNRAITLTDEQKLAISNKGWTLVQ